MRRRALSFEIMFEIFSLSVDPCGFARVRLSASSEVPRTLHSNTT